MIEVPNILQPGETAYSALFNENWAFCLAAVGVLPANTNLGALGVFNVAYYGVTTATSGTLNQGFFTAAATDAQAINGGILYVPAIGGPIAMTGTVATTIGAAPWNNIIIRGATGAQKIAKTDATDCFYIDNLGGAPGDIGGVAISDIHIKYNNPLAAGAGIDVLGGQNTFIERVVLEDAPFGFTLSNTLIAGIRDSKAFFANNVNNSIGFLITGPSPGSNNNQQLSLDRCTSLFSNNGTGTAVGFQITQGKHVTLFDCYTSGAPTGIGLVPSATSGNDITQATLLLTQVGSSQYGVLCQPQSPSGSRLFDFRIVLGQIQAGNEATDTSVGIFIDPNGGENTQVQDGKLYGAVVEGWGLYGLQYNGGTNLQVIGGTYSSNGTAGIAVTGTTGWITVSNADLSASFEGNAGQTYALLVSGSPLYMLVTGCPMFGYSGPPVSITGSPTILRIKDCPGYNDQKTPVVAANSMPTSLTSAALQGYHGMSRYTLGSGVTSYTLNTVTYTAIEGMSLWLDTYDLINQTGSSNGTWVGY